MARENLRCIVGHPALKSSYQEKDLLSVWNITHPLVRLTVVIRLKLNCFEAMVQQTRLGYSYTIGYCIDIQENCYNTCESKSNNRFTGYIRNSRNCLKLLD